ncbi:MAG: transposase [Desulfitobacteriaceae bacterium]
MAGLVPPTCHVILLADRGFASAELFRALDALHWDWIIRSKGVVGIDVDGRWKPLCLRWIDKRALTSEVVSLRDDTFFSWG